MTRRILLIEDEPLSQDIITSLLRGQGYAVDVATDGFAALDRVRAVHYDVALIDYHLPEMDGYALGRLLREQHPGGDTGPILIGLTADRNGLAARRGSDAVFRAILPKPIKPAELFEAIERLCETAGRPSSAQTPAQPADTRRAAAVLWRSHGLDMPPRACASPAPTIEQSSALTLCFELVEPELAQCVVLLERHGINEALRIAKRGRAEPLPIIGLSQDHADICDSLFRVDDPASWKALASMLGGVAPESIARIHTMPAHIEAAAVAAAIADDSATDDIAAEGIVIEEAEPNHAASSDIGKPQPGIAASILRTLLLSGVRAPLDALRSELAAQQRSQAAPDPGQLATLDSVLLITGTIADALNMPAARTCEAAIFDPAELAENALAMIRDSRPPGAVRLSCRISDSVPRLLRGDVHGLSQAVLTLLDDACCGAEPAMLALHLAFDAERNSLTLRLNHEGATSEPAQNEGVVALLRNLRLTMLGRLVKLMGGTLSQDGGQVLLTVPLESEVNAPAQQDNNPASEPAHVLLIDDGATSGQVLTLLLTQEGHRVCRVRDSEAALFACRNARHDLVIFDLASGVEARLASLESVRQFQTSQADVPALVLANTFSTQEEARLRGWGVACTLAKPFSPEALGNAVAACRLKRVEPSPLACAAIDARVRDALAQALGDQTVERLTGQLLAQIEALTGVSEITAEATSRLIELSGCASVLGLAELAAHCAAPKGAVAIPGALLRLRTALETRQQAAA
ncbi:Response regulator receiver domain-containing protein [Bosea sp. OK403]|uniref:response regulator n=1 Tax=Bosea sp. OK403 TaxID=1855286 RepID=UPI0008E2640D|nr:response regulator [Bosea sp. OK403]SFI88093.1 Response regulator receiver domain-containing protein [Bosea sp. OK403]